MVGIGEYNRHVMYFSFIGLILWGEGSFCAQPSFRWEPYSFFDLSVSNYVIMSVRIFGDFYEEDM